MAQSGHHQQIFDPPVLDGRVEFGAGGGDAECECGVGVRMDGFLDLDAVGLIPAADVHAVTAGRRMGISGAIHLHVEFLRAIPIPNHAHVESDHHFVMVGW